MTQPQPSPAAVPPWAWLATAAAVAAQRTALGFWPCDDAFITFRCAYNLAQHGQLAFNVGEPIFGCTTLAYAFALAALRLAGLSIPVAAAAWTAVADEAVCLLLLRLARDSFGDFRWGLLAAALWLTHPLLALNGVAGMETSTFVALLLAYVLACRTGRFGLGLALLAGLVATRPDGLAVAPVWLYAWLRTGRPRPALGPTLVAAGLAASYLIFTLTTYGSPLPQSALAKAQACPATAGGPFVLALSFVASISGLLSTWHWFLAPHFLLIPGLLYVVARFRRQDATTQLLALAAVCHAGLFVLSARPCVMYFQWYYAPFLSLIILPALRGTPAVARRLREALSGRADLYLLGLLSGGALGYIGVVRPLYAFRETHGGWPAHVIPALIAGNEERLARFVFSVYLSFVVAFVVGCGIYWALQLRPGRPLKWPRATPALAAAVFLAVALLPLLFDWEQMTLRYQRREAAYLQLGAWAAANAPRGDWLGAKEIGAFGWGAREYRIYDELGLFTPAALRTDRPEWLPQFHPALVVGSSSLDVPLIKTPPQYDGYETVRAGHTIVAVRDDLAARWHAAPPEVK